jgi:hypothetical protein
MESASIGEFWQLLATGVPPFGDGTNHNSKGPAMNRTAQLIHNLANLDKIDAAYEPGKVSKISIEIRLSNDTATTVPVDPPTRGNFLRVAHEVAEALPKGPGELGEWSVTDPGEQLVLVGFSEDGARVELCSVEGGETPKAVVMIAGASAKAFLRLAEQEPEVVDRLRDWIGKEAGRAAASVGLAENSGSAEAA